MLKKYLRDTCEPMDHVFLNDMPPFDVLNPTSENMAIYIGDKMQQALANNPNPVEVAEVKVWETDIQSATYRPAALSK
jgi:6-pyruvoyltetrahydropterin/6-carboxytetrahydropterin synthase